MGKAVDEFLSLKRPRHRSRDLSAQTDVGIASATGAGRHFKARCSLIEALSPKLSTFADICHSSCANDQPSGADLD
jgi:hypothetical protein